MQSFLRYGVILSFFISWISLLILIWRTFAFGRRRVHAASAGEERGGIAYAFGRGLMPWEKESARKHLPTYIAGVFYHSGIFSGMFYLLSVVVPFGLNVYISQALRFLITAGLLCGLALLVKRITLPYMRSISCPDDFVSNPMVNLFLVLALLDPIVSSLRSVLFIVTIILFLYIPLGKIRHCFFFFYSRILFGQFFGRRGAVVQR